MKLIINSKSAHAILSLVDLRSHEPDQAVQNLLLYKRSYDTLHETKCFDLHFPFNFITSLFTRI